MGPPDEPSGLRLTPDDVKLQPGITTAEATRIAELEREVRELRRANSVKVLDHRADLIRHVHLDADRLLTLTRSVERVFEAAELALQTHLDVLSEYHEAYR